MVRVISYALVAFLATSMLSVHLTARAAEIPNCGFYSLGQNCSAMGCTSNDLLCDCDGVDGVDTCMFSCPAGNVDDDFPVDFSLGDFSQACEGVETAIEGTSYFDDAITANCSIDEPTIDGVVYETCICTLIHSEYGPGVDFGCGRVLSAADDEDDDDDDDVPPIADIVAAIQAELPDKCSSAVKSAVTEELVQCLIFTFESEDEFEFDLKLACKADCLGIFSKAIDIMSKDEDCLPAVDADDDTDDIGLIALSYTNMAAEYVQMLMPLCTQSSSNNKLCGEVVPLFEDLYSDGMDEDVCEEVASFGACLGTFAATLEEDDGVFMSIDPVFTLQNMLYLTGNCSADFPSLATQFETALASTEAPVDFSSGASGVVAMFALVGISPIIALFA